ncbi:MAG: CocE/NonD family hydrolase [Acidobacteriota bacterium]
MKRKLFVGVIVAFGFCVAAGSWMSGAHAASPAPPADPQVRGMGNAPPPPNPLHSYSITKPMKGSETPMELTFVFSRDEIYVPIVLRRPKGPGPFPAILMSAGNGTGGMPRAISTAERLVKMTDLMLARGYVVVNVEPRNEIPYLYQTQGRAVDLPDSVSGGNRVLKSNATLDSDDYIAVIQFLQAQPFIDKDAVGCIGVSHSGELIMKAASEIAFGAGVPIEGATNEYLEIDNGPKAPRKENEVQFQDAAVVEKFANKAKAMERIKKIKTPLLVIGRDKDHQQGIFRLTYDWTKEAGKDVAWASFDHPVHGYPFMYVKADGTYAPDPIQLKAFETFMAFFDARLKHNHAAPAK